MNDKRVDEESGERQKFSSRILPAYARRSPKVGEVIPILYLRGLSTGDFKPALESLLGEDAAGLSPTTISRLCKEWEEHHERFRKRHLGFSRYAYLFMDGITSRSVRRGPEGVPTDRDRCARGRREGAARGRGRLPREHESWAGVFRDMKRRGLNEPKLVVGDGALGAWAALRDVYPGAGEQRCWFHASGNSSTACPSGCTPARRGCCRRSSRRRPARTPGSRSRPSARSTARSTRRWRSSTRWTQLTAFYDYPPSLAALRTTNRSRARSRLCVCGRG